MADSDKETGTPLNDAEQTPVRSTEAETDQPAKDGHQEASNDAEMRSAEETRLFGDAELDDFLDTWYEEIGSAIIESKQVQKNMNL